MSCIVNEQPCLKLAAECSLFVHDVKRRNTSQEFGGVSLGLSKGLVNQEMQLRPARAARRRRSVVSRFSRYAVTIAGISAKVNHFPDFQV
jgi:hypothetical protein